MNNTVAVPPDMVRWVPRNAENGDCAITALQLATGMTYESVLAGALKVSPNILTNGLSWPEIRRIARKLGFNTKLLRRGRYDLDEATGILNVVHKKDGHHVVYLWEGRVIEPQFQSLWKDPDAFLKHHKYRATSLLVLEGTT